jgi:hypothetical protein
MFNQTKKATSEVFNKGKKMTIGKANKMTIGRANKQIKMFDDNAVPNRFSLRLSQRAIRKQPRLPWATGAAAAGSLALRQR